MVFEHFALNVDDPHAISDWYCTHLHTTIALKKDEAPFTVFLADSAGRIFCELYSNPDGGYLDFKSTHHLTFHMAFVSKDANTDMARLLEAGCSLVEEIKSDEHHLVMLRDPFGIPLQLCQRNYSMG